MWSFLDELTYIHIFWAHCCNVIVFVAANKIVKKKKKTRKNTTTDADDNNLHTIFSPCTLSYDWQLVDLSSVCNSYNMCLFFIFENVPKSLYRWIGSVKLTGAHVWQVAVVACDIRNQNKSNGQRTRIIRVVSSPPKIYAVATKIIIIIIYGVVWRNFQNRNNIINNVAHPSIPFSLSFYSNI